jgi:hypothetical protein
MHDMHLGHSQMRPIRFFPVAGKLLLPQTEYTGVLPTNI